MAWLESHQSLGRHPKTKAGARRLGISRVQMVGHLHYLWWWALDFAEDGDLSATTVDDIAEEAMWEGDAQEFVDALVEVGFLTAERHINDWDEYTGRLRGGRESYREANRLRQQRYRERQRNSDVTDTDNVTVTSRNGPTIPNHTVPNSTEPLGDKSPKPPARDEHERRFEQFWSVYPKRVGKDAARRWWLKAKPSDDLTETMIAAIKRQQHSVQWCKDGGQFIPNPSTWLNQGRWQDDPSVVVPNGSMSLVYGSKGGKVGRDGLTDQERGWRENPGPRGWTGDELLAMSRASPDDEPSMFADVIDVPGRIAR